MPSEKGTVVGLRGDRAIVKTSRSAQCEGCTSSHVCDHTTDSEMLVEAINNAQASVGDSVLLEVPDATFLAGSFLVYLVPIFALVAGVFIGNKIGLANKWDNETTGFLAGILFLGITLLAVRSYGNKKFSTDASLLPRVTGILKSKI